MSLASVKLSLKALAGLPATTPLEREQAQDAFAKVIFDAAQYAYAVPGAHAASHALGDSDPITIEQAQVTGLTTILADVTDATALATANKIAKRDASAGFAVAYFQVDTAPLIAQTRGVGKFIWNSTHRCVEYGMTSNVNNALGQELVQWVRNNEVTPLVDGEVVYVVGSTGAHNTVRRADASLEATSSMTIGVVTEPIGAHPGEGMITTFGLVTCDTNHLTEGGQVWLSEVSGATTDTRPPAPAHGVLIGFCVKKAGPADGLIFVHIQNGYELDELHDVLVGAKTNGDVLTWDATAGVWKNLPGPAGTYVAKTGDGMSGQLRLAAGTAAVGTAPLKFLTGVLNAVAEVGALEFVSDDLYFTITTGAARKRVLLADAALTAGRIPFTTTNGRLTDSSTWTRNATTGQVIQTYNGVTASVYQLVNTNPAASAQAYTQYTVDAGSWYFGAESNAGGLSPGGGFIYTGLNKPFRFYIGGINRLDLSSAGVLTSNAPGNIFNFYGKFGSATVGLNTLLAVGSVSGNFGGSTAAAHFTDNSVNATVNFQNTLATGYTAFDFFGDTNIKSASFAWSNSTAAFFPGALWIMTRVAGDMVLGTNTTEVLRLRNATKNVEIATGNLVLPKTSGVGIKVDPAAPTFGWRDLTCAIDPRATGTGTPVRTLYRGTIYQYAFTAGDIADFDDGFHIPHDYVPGTDLYVHVHWSHNGTAISGSAVFEITMTYAKGHNQANFGPEVTQTITVATPDIATVPQYRHRGDEVQASTAGGSATRHNTTDIEVDGMFLGYIKLVTLPTVTGGSLFVHTVGIHYQSSNMATKGRAPNFYT